MEHGSCWDINCVKWKQILKRISKLRMDSEVTHHNLPSLESQQVWFLNYYNSVCVCVCMAHICTCSCACVWEYMHVKTYVNTGYFLTTLHLTLNRVSHWMQNLLSCEDCWPISPREPPVSASSGLGLQARAAAAPAFYEEARGLAKSSCLSSKHFTTWAVLSCLVSQPTVDFRKSK